METEIKIMIIYVDIDETICITNSDRDYTASKPIQKNIDIINALHEKGLCIGHLEEQVLVQIGSILL